MERIRETSISSRWVDFHIMRRELIYKDVSIEELEEAIGLAVQEMRLDFADILNDYLVALRKESDL